MHVEDVIGIEQNLTL